MLAVLDCLRRLQANLTELTWATQQCISAEWLAMTGYWLLHGAINALITTFLAMHCEVFCGLGQVAVIDRRQCIEHNGLLIDIAQLAAASMISGLPSYDIIIKPFRSFSIKPIWEKCVRLCQWNLASKLETYVQQKIRIVVCRCFGGGLRSSHGSASITCGSSSSDFTSSSRGPGWLKPGPSTSDGEPSSPNSHNQRFDFWKISRFPKANTISGLLGSIYQYLTIFQNNGNIHGWSFIQDIQGPDQQPAGFLLRQLNPEAARRTRPGFSGGWDLQNELMLWPLGAWHEMLKNDENRLVIWLQQILSIWRLNPPFGSVSPPPQLLKWSYMAKLRHKATTFLMSHSALGFSGFVPGFLNKGPCITRYSTVAWPCPPASMTSLASAKYHANHWALRTKKTSTFQIFQ